MTGVRAALETGDDVKVFREQIDDLALALVAPLGPYDRYAKRDDKDAVAVCEKLLSRTCEAVALFLKTAGELAESGVAA